MADIKFIRGHLEEKVVNRGTASEHKSWILTDWFLPNTKTHGNMLIMKKLGENPFVFDDTAFGLGGPGFIEASGYLIETREFRFVSIRSINSLDA